MKFQVVSEKEEPLLDRKTIILKVEKEETPSRKEIIDLVKAHFNAEHFVIRKIEQKFGKHEAEVVVRIYNSRETLLQLEPKYILERMKKAEVSEDAQRA